MISRRGMAQYVSGAVGLIPPVAAGGRAAYAVYRTPTRGHQKARHAGSTSAARSFGAPAGGRMRMLPQPAPYCLPQSHAENVATFMRWRRPDPVRSIVKALPGHTRRGLTAHC